MTWQPITATSPPWDGVPVLVWREGNSVWISGRKQSRYAGMGYDWYLGSQRFPPTHWMPIPEPPPTAAPCARQPPPPALALSLTRAGGG